MSNHCYNQLTIQSTYENIDKIMEHLRGPETMFDFNNLVPMPELMKDIQVIHLGEKQYFYSKAKWRKHLNDAKELYPVQVLYPSFPDKEWVTENAVDDFTIRRLTMDHGTAYWYDWSCSNWGTKSNAYDVEYFVGPIPNATIIEDGRQLTYRFTTAWAEPQPVIKALMHYLAQPEFDQYLEMRWRFRDEQENYDGEISNKDDESLYE
tara:strand:- start:698 stop:1318 length:621 start_codon:yes stop_codon:yes gene_type:complete